MRQSLTFILLLVTIEFVINADFAPVPITTEPPTSPSSGPPTTRSPNQDWKTMRLRIENELLHLSQYMKSVVHDANQLISDPKPEAIKLIKISIDKQIASIEQLENELAVEVAKSHTADDKWFLKESLDTLALDRKELKELHKTLKITSASPTPKPTTVSTPEPTTASTPKSTTASTPEPTTASTLEPTTASTPEPTTASTLEPTTASTPEPTTASTPKPATTPTPNQGWETIRLRIENDLFHLSQYMKNVIHDGNQLISDPKPEPIKLMKIDIDKKISSIEQLEKELAVEVVKSHTAEDKWFLEESLDTLALDKKELNELQKKLKN